MSVASVRVCSIETVMLLFFYLPQNPHVEGETLLTMLVQSLDQVCIIVLFTF
jgi:hypothetical protein